MYKQLYSILAGIFFIFAGFLFMLRNILPLHCGHLLFAIAGVELIVMHIFTKKTFPLVLGSFLAYGGILRCFDTGYELQAALISATIFFAPTVIFLFLYFKDHKRAQLTWLFLFFFLGVDVIILRFLDISAVSALFLCMGSALVLDYIAGMTYSRTTGLQFGVALIILGALKLLDLSIYFNILLPAALIWLGILFFIKAIKG